MKPNKSLVDLKIMVAILEKKKNEKKYDFTATEAKILELLEEYIESNVCIPKAEPIKPKTKTEMIDFEWDIINKIINIPLNDWKSTISKGIFTTKYNGNDIILMGTSPKHIVIQGIEIGYTHAPKLDRLLDKIEDNNRLLQLKRLHGIFVK